MMKHDRAIGRALRLVCLAGIGLACGCGATGSSLPIAPGDTPFVLIKVINRSSQFTIDFLIQTETTTTTGTVATSRELRNVRSNGGNAALIVQCPADRIGLGNLNDPESIGFRVGFPGQEKIGVAWGQAPLVSGFSYNCGDLVVFLATDSATEPSGVRIDTGLIGGASEVGPFTGPDTYENLEDLLRSEGLLI